MAWWMQPAAAPAPDEPRILMLDHLIVFAIALGAATLLPFFSEPVLAGYVAAGQHHWAGLWLAATVGNTLGAWINWIMGRWLRGHGWLPFSRRQLRIATRWYRRYGVWSLLMAWAPIGGDALTFIAGVLRAPWWLFLILVAIGKGLRYLLIVWAAAGLLA